MADVATIQAVFDQAPQPMLIVKNQQVIAQNQAATSLFEDPLLTADTLVNLAQLNQTTMSTIAQHNDCQLLDQARYQVVPINSQAQPELAKLNLMLAYYPIDPQTYVIVLHQGMMNARMAHLQEDNQLVAKINQAQESERQRVAADLHDSVAQTAAMALMGLRHAPSADCPELQMVSQQLESLVAQVKNISRELYPAVLDQVGLVAAIQTLIERLQSGTEVALSFIPRVEQVASLTKPVQLTLYRIAQEALSNALRHAEASWISVLLIQHHDQVTLEIMDDGVGFALPKPGSHQGMGLLTMQARVRALNGAFDVSSDRRTGTTIRAKFLLSQEGTS